VTRQQAIAELGRLCQELPNLEAAAAAINDIAEIQRQELDEIEQLSANSKVTYLQCSRSVEVYVEVERMRSEATRKLEENQRRAAELRQLLERNGWP